MASPSPLFQRGPSVPRTPWTLAARAGATGLLGLFLAWGLWAGPALASPSPAGSGATTTTTTSPKQLINEAVAAADQETSVHYVASSTYGNRSVTLTGDVSATEGQQLVTLHFGSSIGHVTSRLVNKVIYLRADKFGLTEYLGMPSSLAAKYSGKWISFDSSDSGYSTTAESLTLKAAVDQISINGPYKTSTVSVDGSQDVSVTGTTTSLSSKGKKGPATLVLSSTGTPLPVRYEGQGVQDKKTATAMVAFSDWGETVELPVPSPAVAASSIKS